MAMKIRCECGGVIICTRTKTVELEKNEMLVIRYRQCVKCKRRIKTTEKIKIQ